MGISGPFDRLSRVKAFHPPRIPMSYSLLSISDSFCDRKGS